MKRILFVCHGNICRSPMAEFIMKKLVEEAHLQDSFHIASAATSTEELGNSVDPPARRKLAEHGISCDGKTARHAQVGAGRELPRVKRIQRLAKEGRLSGLREALDEKQVSGGGSLQEADDRLERRARLERTDGDRQFGQPTPGQKTAGRPIRRRRRFPTARRFERLSLLDLLAQRQHLAGLEIPAEGLAVFAPLVIKPLLPANDSPDDRSRRQLLHLSHRMELYHIGSLGRQA